MSKVELQIVRFFDRNGGPLSGGMLYLSSIKTGKKEISYFDNDCKIKTTYPIILDANGEARFYTRGEFNVKLLDRDNVLLMTADCVKFNTTYFYPEPVRYNASIKKTFFQKIKDLW